jgi:hypothetical protein
MTINQQYQQKSHQKQVLASNPEQPQMQRCRRFCSSKKRMKHNEVVGEIREGVCDGGKQQMTINQQQ